MGKPAVNLISNITICKQDNLLHTTKEVSLSRGNTVTGRREKNPLSVSHKSKGTSSQKTLANVTRISTCCGDLKPELESERLGYTVQLDPEAGSTDILWEGRTSTNTAEYSCQGRNWETKQN